MSIKSIRPSQKIFCSAFDIHTQHMLSCQESNLCLKFKQQNKGISLATTIKRTQKLEDQDSPKFLLNQNQDQEFFKLAEQWYPVYPAMFLDPKDWTLIQLVGKNLVLWRDEGEQVWRCCESSSTLPTATLEKGENSEEVAQAELKYQEFAAKEYTTRVKFGLLWVWGGAENPPQTEKQNQQSPLQGSASKNNDKNTIYQQLVNPNFIFNMLQIFAWIACALVAVVALSNSIFDSSQMLNLNGIQLAQFKAVFYGFFTIVLGWFLKNFWPKMNSHKFGSINP